MLRIPSSAGNTGALPVRTHWRTRPDGREPAGSGGGLDPLFVILRDEDRAAVVEHTRAVDTARRAENDQLASPRHACSTDSRGAEDAGENEDLCGYRTGDRVMATDSIK